MIRITVSTISPLLPIGKVTFEGPKKELQSLMQKLKIARTFDRETKSNLDADEISQAILKLLK